MILTLALLLMCGAGIGSLLLMMVLSKFVHAINHNQVHTAASHDVQLHHLTTSIEQCQTSIKITNYRVWQVRIVLGSWCWFLL